MGFSEAAINIEKYFKEHLPSYEVVEARRKSGHVPGRTLGNMLYGLAGMKSSRL